MIPPLTEEGGEQRLREDIERHIISTLGNDSSVPRKDTFYNGLAYSVRDRLLRRWIEGQRAYYDSQAKRVYYLSLEFLPGRFLMNYMTQPRGIRALCERSTCPDGVQPGGAARRRSGTPGWATAASAGSPPASSIRWRR